MELAVEGAVPDVARFVRRVSVLAADGPGATIWTRDAVDEGRPLAEP